MLQARRLVVILHGATFSSAIQLLFLSFFFRYVDKHLKPRLTRAPVKMMDNVGSISMMRPISVIGVAAKNTWP